MVTSGNIVMIHDLKHQGLSVSAIAKHTGLNRKTVYRHLERGMMPATYRPRAPKPRLLDPYTDYLAKRLSDHSPNSTSSVAPRSSTSSDPQAPERATSLSLSASPLSALAKAHREGRLPQKIRFYNRPSLLIVDEIGYVSIDSGGANLFFQLVNARYEKGAMILTSNRGFTEWGELFGDPVLATALLDRLLHHAVVIRIEGASYRLRKHTELIPEHIRANAQIPPPPPPKRRGRPPKKSPIQPI